MPTSMTNVRETLQQKILYRSLKVKKTIHLAEKLGYQFDHEYVAYEVP